MPAHATPKVRLYAHVPTTIFRARVNMPGTITYPITALTFDGVTLGVFGDIQPDMTLMLGTTADADDLGRVRVQNLASATQIPVGRVSQGIEDGTLYVQDNAYISVWEDYRVWAKLPYMNTDTGIDHKDGDIIVGDYDTEQPPVCVIGPGFADYIATGTNVITVTFDSSLSYAVADGATIASRTWDIQDGTLTVGTLTSTSITVTFPAGFRYVHCSIVDSNGKGHTSRTPVLAVDPAADVTVDNSKCTLTQRLTQTGQTLDVQMHANMLRTSWPDGCLVMLWWDAPSGPTDRTHMKFIGWLQSESFAIRATKTGLARDTVLRCVDVAGRLETLPGFPQALVREEEEDEDLQWALMPTLDMSKALHYLLHWHSTALTVADFFLPIDGEDYPTMALLMGGATLHDQVSSLALQLTPDHVLACNSRGQLSVLEDWMLVDVGSRPAASSILTEDDYSELSVDYHRPPRVHVLRASAVVASTDWIQVAGVDTLPLAFSIAPGDAFSQGTSEQQEAEGLTISQAALNTATGHKYARLNARFGLARLKLPAPDAWDYEPALLNRIQLNIAAAYAAQRGLPFTQINAQVKELNIRYVTDKTGTWIDPELTLEFETSGFPAVTVIPDESVPADPEVPEPDDLPTEPPDMGLIEDVEDVAGVSMDGFVYRTDDFQTLSGSGGPTWDEVDLSTGAIYSFVVDPFSPGYILGVGTVDGWVVSETDIYRVEDLFGTPTATSVHTFAVANDMAEFHWRTIQASFGAYFAEGVNPWLVCISYYGDTVGHTGTWCKYSLDGGATWAAEVPVSEFYSTAPGVSHQPIAVYASPKTPGLAYTVAHITTETQPRTDAYVSTDWGATWARLASIPVDSVAEPLPHWAVFHESGPDAAVTVGGFFRGGAVELAAGGVSSSTHDYRFLFAPHADTVRAVLDCHWEAGRAQDTSSGGSAGQTLSFSITHKAGEVNMVETMDYDSPGTNSSTEEDFTVTWTRSVGKTEWNGHRDELAAELADPTDAEYCRWLSTPNATKTGNAKSEVSIELTATVTELELENGHIYVPGAEAGGLIQPDYGKAGTIHIPWPDNAAENLAYYGNFNQSGFRQFRLYRNAGVTATDISPSDGSIEYGVNRGMFGVRSHDTNRQYVLLAGTGNDTTGFANGDKHAVFVSSDYGDNFTQIVEEQAADGTGRDGFEAAFGGDSEQILFIWGPALYISYSSNFGVALDSKAGNLAALGAGKWIGIAGGATG